MKELYSIGEVSKIMGVSVQTLRYYSSIGILEPKHVSETSGYRYYSADQFHFIDRIKYLQKLGMTLDEIHDIIASNDIPKLIERLDSLKVECEQEITRLVDTVDTIEWYKDYFVNATGSSDKVSFVKRFPKRWLVATEIRPDDTKADFHIRLSKMRSSPELGGLKYMRQYAYLLDYDALLSKRLVPSHLGMFVKSAPRETSPGMLEIPEGSYYCFRARILSEGWDPYVIKMFFDRRDPKPSLVAAIEFEDDIHEYSRCPYEVQILIPQREGER